MEKRYFTVSKIEGEYAYLLSEEGEELFIALALLPFGCDVGTYLAYENLEFSIIINPPFITPFYRFSQKILIDFT